MADSKIIHGTCVSVDGKGVLLIGPPGSGKSDLALRMIDRGARLVSDDQVECTSSKKAILVSPPKELEGLFEIRGVGIFRIPYSEKIPLVLVVKLVSRANVERMPEPEVFHCLDLQVPLLSLYAFDHSTDAKIRLFLQTF